MKKINRRQFIRDFSLVGAGAVLSQVPGFIKSRFETGIEISPAEDLMREHGVLNRIMLIYEESLRRIKNNQEVDLNTINKAAKIIRTFIEDYHEKLEEDFIFPLFRQDSTLYNLVNILQKQHNVGRDLTTKIIELSKAPVSSDYSLLIAAIENFVYMYRPHEAWEDTVLFPAIHKKLSPKKYAELGEMFEEKEHDLFGKEGFEKVVQDVSELEQILDIHQLDKFTAKT